MFCRFVYFLAFACFLGLTSCNATHEDGTAASSSIYDTALDQAALSITAANCDSCHGSTSPGFGGFSGSNSVVGALASGTVVSGDLGASTFYQQVDGGTMPPDGPPLSTEDQEILELWILSLADR